MYVQPIVPIYKYSTFPLLLKDGKTKKKRKYLLSILISQACFYLSGVILIMNYTGI